MRNEPLHCPLSPFRFFLPPTAGERVILSLLDSFPHKSFACGERRFISKKKSRLAAGDAPVQVSSLSDSGITKNFLVIFYTLFGAIRGSRAVNCDLYKTGAAERTVFPKRVNGSQGQCPPVPCGSEGKPDFPLKSDQILFLYASR